MSNNNTSMNNNSQFTLDLTTNNSSVISNAKIYSNQNREGPSQKIDKSLLNKMSSVPTKSNNHKSGDKKRDCVIY